MMEEVRLTPSERRILEEIECELRKDPELDLALRTMRPTRARRRAAKRTTKRTAVIRAGDRRGSRRPTATRTWRVLLAVVLCAALFAAVATASPAYLAVVGFAVLVMGCATGLVWLCVGRFMRRPGRDQDPA